MSEPTIEALVREAELIQEEIALRQRIQEIQAERNGSKPVTVKQASPVAEQSQEAPKPKKSPGRPKKVKTDDGKGMSLLPLLENILKQSSKPMSHPELVKAALEAGYKSSSNDFSTVVYVTLLRGVKEEKLNKSEDKTYTLVNAAA